MVQFPGYNAIDVFGGLFTPLDIYTFGHLKCPKAERIAPDKTPTSRRFNWQKV